MKNIREDPRLDNEFTSAWERTRRVDAWTPYWIIVIGVGMGLGALLAPALTFGLGLPEALGLTLGFLCGMGLPIGATNLGRLYKGHGLEYDTSRMARWDFPARAEEYFSLSVADRALYPKDIIDALRDPDLTIGQKIALDDQMRGLYEEVSARDKAKAVLEKRHVDVSHLLEEMGRARASVAIETKTFKEYS